MLLLLPFDESISQGFLTLEKAIRAETKFNFASFGANSDDNDWLVACYGWLLRWLVTRLVATVKLV